MKNRFIDSVLKHISSKNQKRIVSAELEDHLLSRTEALEEIGYERAEAQRISEERMGDAEIVGEQLNAIHRTNTFGNILILFLSLVFAFSWIIVQIIKDNYFVFQSVFTSFAIAWFIYILSMILLTVELKRGLPISSVITAVGICYLVNTSDYIVNTPVLLFDFKRLIGFFFTPIAFDATYFYFPDTILNIRVLIAFYISAILPVFAVLFTSIRSRRLINKRIDLRLKKFFCAFLSVIIAVCIAIIALITISSISYEKSSINKARDSLSELDALVLDNYDIIFGNDDKKAVGFLEKNAPKETQFNKDYWEEGSKFERSVNIFYNCVTLTLSYDNSGLSYLDISPTITGLNGKTPEIIPENVLPFAESYNGELSGVPKPCLIELDRNDGFVRVRYASNIYDRGKYIEYNFKNGKANFSENIFRNEKAVKLTLRQKKILLTALNEFYRHSYYDKYLDYEGVPFIKIFGVSLDESNNEYKIDMFYNPEWATVIDGNLYDLRIDHKEDFCSFKVKFTDKKAMIISELLPKEYGNYEDVFSEESNKERGKWKESWDTAYYHLRRLEKRYKQKVYGIITDVEDDGTIHYFKYNDYEISTVPESKEEIMKKMLSSTFEPLINDEDQTIKYKE